MSSFVERMADYVINLEAKEATVNFFNELCSKKNESTLNRELTDVGKQIVFDVAESVDFRGSGNAQIIRQLSLLTGITLAAMIKEFQNVCKINARFPGLVVPHELEGRWLFTYRQNDKMHKSETHFSSAAEAKRQMRMFCNVPIPGEENVKSNI